MIEINLSPASKELFLDYAKDAGNWSGTPLVGGNVGGNKEDRGNLTDLKRKKLVTTFEYEGEMWVEFTPLGQEYAKQNGVAI